MTNKEQVIHETIEKSLLNLMDRIDLAIYHIQQSNCDYEHHIGSLYEQKRQIKKILNKDFDRLALASK